MENNPNPENSGAPFNAAIATLMRIDKILTDIKGTIVYVAKYGCTPAEAVYIKYKLVRQLYVQARPLISNKTEKERLKKIIEDLKVPIDKYGHPQTTFKFDCAMDNAVIEIQEALQAEGIFMPNKEDIKGL